MKRIVSPEEMATMDRQTIAGGISSRDLMEKAGQACSEILMSRTGLMDRVLVLCGGGNNGGDGFVIAKVMAERGNPVRVVCLGNLGKMSEESRFHYAQLANSEDLEIDIIYIDDACPERLQPQLAWCRVIVDCIFGNGLKARPLSDFYVGVIEKINETAVPTYAIDIPSGLRGDTGLALNAAVHADLTIAIQHTKIGCLLADGPDLCGEIDTVDIGIDGETDAMPKFLTEHGDFVWPMPRRLNSHKYDYGCVVSLAGSRGMYGAAVLAARAALTVGAGLVTAFVPKSEYGIFAVKMPDEIMVLPTGETLWNLDFDEYRKDVILFGPGFGRDRGARLFLIPLMEQSTPAVIDADGLWHLAQNKALLDNHEAPLVLTPHMGEFAMLCGKSVSAIQAALPDIAVDFAVKYRVVLVLKGYRTMIVTPRGEVFFNGTGNPGMATAGSGDVLAGMIAGIIAQGTDPVEAAKAGVYYHGLAGDTFAGRFGESTLTASSIIEFLKIVING